MSLSHPPHMQTICFLEEVFIDTHVIESVINIRGLRSGGEVDVCDLCYVPHLPKYETVALLTPLFSGQLLPLSNGSASEECEKGGDDVLAMNVTGREGEILKSIGGTLVAGRSLFSFYFLLDPCSHLETNNLKPKVAPSAARKINILLTIEVQLVSTIHRPQMQIGV